MFLHLFVSWSQSFLVLKLQSFNDPILPKFGFVLSGKYWSCCQDVQEFIRRIVEISRHLSFPCLQHFSFPTFWDLQKSYVRKWFVFLGFVKASCYLQRWMILVLGLRDTSENPDIMKMIGCRSLTWNRCRCSSDLNRDFICSILNYY